MRLLFDGQLRASPFAGTPFLSDIRPRTLETEEDFVAYAAMARSQWAPVWMSFPQKCGFLDTIVQHIRETLWEDIDRLLMVCRVPGIRMPVELGHEKILQVVDLEPEVERLAGWGESFLSLHEGFVRHPLETGDNELRIEWHHPRGPLATAKFEALSARLRGMGLQPGRGS